MTIARYTYSISQTPNPEREICFIRPGNPSTIKAEVYSLNPAGQRTQTIAVISGASITVEMNSASQKRASAMMPGRFLLQDKSLSELSLDQQTAVLNSLAPSGSKKIEVEGGILNGRAVEVSNMSIFDPS